MGRSVLLLGFCALAALAARGADAAEGYDNPAENSSPCLVLNRYEALPAAGSGGPPGYHANAALENICGRSLDVSFCFQYAVDAEPSRLCFGGVVRPWGSTDVMSGPAPARITGPVYEWRYLPTGGG